jgi:hypothetical protein
MFGESDLDLPKCKVRALDPCRFRSKIPLLKWEFRVVGQFSASAEASSWMGTGAVRR